MVKINAEEKEKDGPVQEHLFDLREKWSHHGPILLTKIMIHNASLCLIIDTMFPAPVYIYTM